jgi:stearoyl-CoA desaturase (delta-9 desaturase)
LRATSLGDKFLITKIKHWAARINWTFAVVLAAFHIGAVAALFFFSWQGLGLALLLLWVCGGLGIGLSYHRLLTHRSFKAPKWIEYLFTIFATMALEGGPLFWVATHRKHHRYTDQAGDPHSPRDGKWWSHIGWLLLGTSQRFSTAEFAPYVPDLMKDKFHVWISKWHWVPLLVVSLAIWAVFGWQVMLWATFLRVTVGLHSTWFVNSVTHLWGSRRFATSDDSRNNFWVALLTFGEGWHNNHHAHAQSARHGLRWWEIDMNWYVIQALRVFGLAKDIKLPRVGSDGLEVSAAAGVR